MLYHRLPNTQSVVSMLFTALCLVSAGGVTAAAGLGLAFGASQSQSTISCLMNLLPQHHDFMLTNLICMSPSISMMLVSFVFMNISVPAFVEGRFQNACAGLILAVVAVELVPLTQGLLRSSLGNLHLEHWLDFVSVWF